MYGRDPTTDGRGTKRIIRILITDDHQLVREALRKQIEAQDDLKVVAEATDGIEAIRLAKETSPDIILMDINMPNMDGIKATQEIRKKNYPCSIIGLSLHDDEFVRKSMLDAGAVKFLSKSHGVSVLCDTIRNAVSPTT